MPHYAQEDQVPVPGTCSHSESRLGGCSALGGRFAFGRGGILDLILGPALMPKAKRSFYCKLSKDFLPRIMLYDSYDGPHSGSAKPYAPGSPHGSTQHAAQPMLLHSLSTAWEWLALPDMIPARLLTVACKASKSRLVASSTMRANASDEL